MEYGVIEQRLNSICISQIKVDQLDRFVPGAGVKFPAIHLILNLGALYKRENRVRRLCRSVLACYVLRHNLITWIVWVPVLIRLRDGCATGDNLANA
jgi:hypothetical protein